MFSFTGDSCRCPPTRGIQMFSHRDALNRRFLTDALRTGRPQCTGAAVLLLRRQVRCSANVPRVDVLRSFSHLSSVLCRCSPNKTISFSSQVCFAAEIHTRMSYTASSHPTGVFQLSVHEYGLFPYNRVPYRCTSMHSCRYCQYISTRQNASVRCLL